MPKLTVKHLEGLAEKALELTSPKRLLRRSEPPLSPQGLPYATFNRRMLAATIDAVLMTFLVLPFNDLILQYAYGGVQVDNAAIQQAMSAAPTPAEANMAAGRALIDGGVLRAFGTLMQVQFTLLAAYSFLFWHFYAATPGKLLLRMQIVDAKTGARISDTQSLMRVFAYLLAGFPFMMGFFAIGWNKARRGWHDRLVRTAVIVLPRAQAGAAGSADKGAQAGAAGSATKSAPPADRPSDSPAPEASA